jgi:S-(hydroxymethyl)glutathione dehydrogenase/alcohol dehydrogenase
MGEAPITHIVRRKISVKGSYGAKARSDTPVILDLLSRGRVTLESVNRYINLEDVGTAYDELKSGKLVGKTVVVL